MNCGRFRLLHHIRTGRNSQVWEAIDDETRKKVAIKLLRQDHVDKSVAEYLRREYAVGKKLEHPRIIRYLEMGSFRGFPFVAIEYYGFPNLKLLTIQEFQNLPPITDRIVKESVEAMVYLAKQGYVHRDIKPENILVSSKGEIKLIDFALAQKPQKKGGGLSGLFGVRGKIQGTPSYIPPEQIRVQPVDLQADIYSLGCTFFELCAGKVPYTGFNTNELLTKHLKAAIPALEALNNNITTDFSNLVRDMMAKKPADRPDIATLNQAIQYTAIFKRKPTSAKPDDKGNGSDAA